MKIAVTGASGHIGSCLVRELIKRGDHVKILVHQFKSHLTQLNVEIIQGNLSEPESLKELCSNVDVVIHLAAIIALDNSQCNLVYKTNVGGTKNLIQATINANVKKFIHFSSIHAFQAHPLDQLLDETRPLVKSNKIIYEYTKAESERLVLKAAENGLDAIILNPTAVIGPYDYRNSYLGQVLRKIYKNELPMLVVGGYNWVDVRDVVSATINSINTSRKGEKYILSGYYCTLKELSDLISKIKGGRTPKLIAPIFLAHLACPFYKLYSSITKTDPLYTKQSLNILINSPRNISNNKARKELEFEPHSLKLTLKDTFEWYKENKLLN